MSIHDFNRIDEVYHSMYRRRFIKESVDVNQEDEEYKAKAKSHAPEAAKAIMHKLKLEYGDKFNPEKARAAVKHALGSATEEDCESWMQDYSHTPDQKKEMADYVGQEDAESVTPKKDEHDRAFNKAEQANRQDPMEKIRQKRKERGQEDAEEEHHCKYAAQGCDCGECEECQDNAMRG